MLYVNGQKIALQLIEQEMERMRPEYERTFADMPEKQREDQLRDWSRENVVERALLRQAAARAASLVNEDEVRQEFKRLVDRCGGREAFYKEVEGGPAKEADLLAELKMDMQTDRFAKKIAQGDGEPAEAEMRAFYEKHAADFFQPEMIRASHIIKHVQGNLGAQETLDLMQGIQSRLRMGEDFGKLACEFSDCPENGGDLGYFARGQMVEEFEEMVFSLSVGGISLVFETRFGLHIVKVTDRQPPQPLQFEQVKDRIKKGLVDQMRHDKLMAFIDTEREKARVEDKEE